MYVMVAKRGTGTDLLLVHTLLLQLPANGNEIENMARKCIENNRVA